MFYSAFLELSSCRSIGFGAGPIPWLAINEYCKTYEIDGEQMDDMIYHVQALDSVYLKWEAEQNKKK